MLCSECGAELRAGARFCNVCGARQSASAPEQPPIGSGVEGEDSGVRAKRPPRVPRSGDDAPQQAGGDSGEIATGSLPDPAGGSEHLAPAAPPDSAIPDAALHDFLINPTHDQVNGKNVSSPNASRSAEEWEQLDTEERAALPGAAGGVDAAPSAEFEMPPLAHLARPGADDNGALPFGKRVGPDDALPWPLPPSMIVGGRYRVERLLTDPDDGRQAENQYIVADLQGYERCWSCGKIYGVEAASDQYCQQCGADMLAREFVMTERMLDTESSEAAQEPIEDGESLAVDGEEAPADQTEEDSVQSAEATESQEPPDEARTFTQGRRIYRVEPRVIEPPAFPLGARIEVAMATDVGRTRAGEHNEDSAVAMLLTLAHDSRMRPLALGLVADGLGGHANGQDASRLVARTVAEHIVGLAASPMTMEQTGALVGDSRLGAMLLDAARAANAQLCAENERTGGDMGSTLVAALVYDDTAYLINVGDSRGYIFDEEGLRRITTDHSLVEQLIQNEMIAPEERYTHPKRNQIFRSLGDDLNMQMDMFVQKLKPGNRLLLCSDGLWEMAHDDQMTDILRRTPAPREACDALVSAANENGGEDNITAVLLDISA